MKVVQGGAVGQHHGDVDRDQVDVGGEGPVGSSSEAAEVIKQEDPRGENIYWIGPSGLPEYDGEGTDFHAVKNGYVSITPIQADLTAHRSIAALQDWLESE